jgi:hypothetical protein
MEQKGTLTGQLVEHIGGKADIGQKPLAAVVRRD